MERVKRNAVIAVGLSSLAVLILASGPPVFGWAFPHALLGAACHQDPERCLSVAGVPMALCARCFAIFAGLFIGSGLALISARGRHRALRFLVFAVVLTVLDLSSETVGLYTNVIMVRLVTGWLLGSAIALMIGSQQRPDSHPVHSPIINSCAAMNEFTVNDPPDQNRPSPPSMRMPILIGAVITAGISLIPFANLTCCLPMIFGGLLATFLYSRGLTSPMAMSKGITIGLVTALLGGLLTVLIIDVVWLTQGYQIGAETMKETALWIASLAGEEAVESVREELEATGAQELTPAAFAMQIASAATISAVGGLISGSLGAALFKGRKG